MAKKLRYANRPRWYEIEVTISLKESSGEIASLIDLGYSRHYRGTTRKLDNGTLVAQPRNPLHLIWSRNGRRVRPYRPFSMENIQRS